MTDQPFPNLNSKMTDGAGMLSPVWRSFLQSLWTRTGGSVAPPTGFAALNGSPAQRFAVAASGLSGDAVNLAQATLAFQPVGSYAALTGSPFQVFRVANATGSSQAVSLQQMQAATALKADASNPVFTGAVYLPVYTVAGLPAPTAGAQAYVTDATARTFGAGVIGGGILGTPVTGDGSTWRIG